LVAKMYDVRCMRADVSVGSSLLFYYELNEFNELWKRQNQP
jgi:hypothetical protein